MPMRVKSLTAAGAAFGYPFLGPMNHTLTVRLDASVLTANELDANGYIVPGTPLKADGTLVSGTGQLIRGVVIEPIKVADGNAAADIAAGVDQDIAIGVIGIVQRDIVEDNLGRVLSADEIAAFAAAGSLLTLTAT